MQCEVKKKFKEFDIFNLMKAPKGTKIYEA